MQKKLRIFAVPVEINSWPWPDKDRFARALRDSLANEPCDEVFFTVDYMTKRPICEMFFPRDILNPDRKIHEPLPLFNINVGPDTLKQVVEKMFMEMAGENAWAALFPRFVRMIAKAYRHRLPSGEHPFLSITLEEKDGKIKIISHDIPDFKELLPKPVPVFGMWYFDHVRIVESGSYYRL